MPKGFNPQPKPGTRYIAIELNQEDIEADEVIDLIQLRHIAILPIHSKRDLGVIELMSDAICGGYSTISPVELIAVLYVTTLNEEALAMGANVARTYHNSHPGDTRIRSNSITHIFEANDPTLPLPYVATKLIAKYLHTIAVVDGNEVTLRNRLGDLTVAHLTT
jgi:hypothetical protein